nr:glycosyltransferase family 9 protein [Bacteroidota bacterium]
MQKTKILILRFSSIGDIVLTTPIIRCVKQQVPDCELHYFTKKQFHTVIQHNPYIDKIHLLDDNMSELITELKNEKFDYVIDLHKNQRTWLLKFRLGVKSFTFDKINREKFLITKLKIDVLPKEHIVDRYFEAVQKLNVKNDERGLDYFIAENDYVDLKKYDIENGTKFIAIAIGAQHATKRLPTNKLIEICKKINSQVILLGGPTDVTTGIEIANACKSNVINLCGELTLNQSAFVIKHAYKIITHDTGLMHIAAAMKKPIVSVWGNTIPQFGMYPYYGNEIIESKIVEVKNLSCRPCSKLGYNKCPKYHFDCMNKIDVNEVVLFSND